MKIEWKEAKSGLKPHLVDYESSPTTVYLHKNIRKDDNGMFVYDEAKLTPAEYTVYAAEQTREDNAAIMEAIAEIYEKLD